MHLFQVTEGVRLGLPIVRDDFPHIPTPNGCSGRLLLDEPIVQFIQSRPPDRALRLKSASVDFGKDAILFKKPARRPERLALVHIETAAGDGGKVYLTANAYDEVFKNNKPPVERRYKTFPGLGTQPFCTDETLTEVNKGVEFLDVVALMYPGASFRIYRNGRLEGASPQMFVHWNGMELRATLPRRYDERAAAGFFESAGAG